MNDDMNDRLSFFIFSVQIKKEGATGRTTVTP